MFWPTVTILGTLIIAMFALAVAMEDREKNRR